MRQVTGDTEKAEQILRDNLAKTVGDDAYIYTLDLVIREQRRICDVVEIETNLLLSAGLDVEASTERKRVNQEARVMIERLALICMGKP